MSIEAMAAGRLAVVTGGASGIGLAACRRFAGSGMRVAIVDLPGEALEQAVASVAAEAGDTKAACGFPTDVADPAALHRLAGQVAAWAGPVHVLMANAAVQPGSAILGPQEQWDQVLAVNLHGVIDSVRAFLPGMIASGEPGRVIVTGSKQGITTPPGDPAYNVAKAGVKAFAEAVEHDLRNRDGGRIAAHLLIPGFVFTKLTRGDRTEKPAAAWTAEQTVAFMLTSIERGDFYILCPDNDVDRATDEKRILWAAGDIVENRPPLSRWHPDHGDAFQRFLKG